MKARGSKVQSPGKDEGDSYKTPVKTAGKGRKLQSSTLLREVEPCFISLCRSHLLA